MRVRSVTVRTLKNMKSETSCHMFNVSSAQPSSGMACFLQGPDRVDLPMLQMVHFPAPASQGRARFSFHIYKASENVGAEIFNPESVVFTQLVNDPKHPQVPEKTLHFLQIKRLIQQRLKWHGLKENRPDCSTERARDSDSRAPRWPACPVITHLYSTAATIKRTWMKDMAVEKEMNKERCGERVWREKRGHFRWRQDDLTSTVYVQSKGLWKLKDGDDTNDVNQWDINWQAGYLLQSLVSCTWSRRFGRCSSGLVAGCSRRWESDL